MPFLHCPNCDAMVFVRSRSMLEKRECERCGTTFSAPAPHLSTAELRKRRRLKPSSLPPTSPRHGLPSN
jgi:DNA-directed RNA polymerase subunit M/transcription elongation factor TFIIS